MFSLMRSPHIFLNLINQPRGRMVMEMYCGLLLFINSNLILSAVDVTDQPHSSGQQLCPASSADCQPVQLTPEDSNTACLFSAAITVAILGIVAKLRRAIHPLSSYPHKHMMCKCE